jgi:hypothetical protein
LSDQGLNSQRRGREQRQTRSHERGRSLLAWFITDKRQISASTGYSEAGLFGFSDNLHYAAHRTKQRSE